MTSFSPKIWLGLAACLTPALLYLAFSTGASGGSADSQNGGLRSPTSQLPAPRTDLSAPEAPQAAEIEVPEEARLEIELRFTKVADIDRSAEDLPFAGVFDGIVHGRVLDGDGSALNGALVEVVNGPSSGRAASSSFTGAFRLDGLAPGACALRFSTPSTAALTRKVLIPSTGEAEIEVVLTRGVPFFGKVLAFDGKAVAGAQVEIEGRRAVTNAGGEWMLDEVPSGNDIVVYAWAPGYALQRMQALVPVELPGEDWPGLSVQLMRGAKLEVQPEGFPLTVPLSVSIVPREGYANPNFPAERFIDMQAPVDGSPMVVEGLPQAFLGQVFVAHPLVGAERTSFPLVIGASDPMPIRVKANPAQSARARGRVLVATSGDGAGLADVVVRVEPADLDPYLQSFAGGVGELWPQPSFQWLRAETVTREQGRFEVDIGFPPPWRASARRDGFALAHAVFGPEDDLALLLTPLGSKPGSVMLIVDPARRARVSWARMDGKVEEPALQVQEIAAEEPAALGTFEAGIYRVERTLQGHVLAPVELRVDPGQEARIELGWGRQ